MDELKYTSWPRDDDRWCKWLAKKRKVGGQPGVCNAGQIEVINERDRMISLPENSYEAELVEKLELVLEEATCTTSQHSHPLIANNKENTSG